MNLFNKNQKSNRGIALVIIMIVLVIATAIGIWALTSSRTGLLKAGNRKFSTELAYQAEQALQKAVVRLQNISANTGTDDPVANTNNTSTAIGKTNGNFTPKTITFLTSDICEENVSCGGSTNQSCKGATPLKDFDQMNGNVVCNFLGMAKPEVQVSLVRKQNVVVGTTKTAIFLVNSVATDSSGRKQIMQGVVAVPYDISQAPTLTNSKAVTE